MKCKLKNANEYMNANEKATGLSTGRFYSANANLKMQAGKCKCDFGSANCKLQTANSKMQIANSMLRFNILLT